MSQYGEVKPVNEFDTIEPNGYSDYFPAPFNSLVPTGVKYIRIPVKHFEDRGIILDKIKLIGEFLPEGCFIAGGCLTALLSGSKVKDYDIFAKDSKTLLDAARAFHSVATLNPTNEEEEKLSKKMEFIAGYDFAEGIKTIDDLKKTSNRYIDLKPPKGIDKPYVQFIKMRFYNTVEETIDSFDFTIAQIGYDPMTEEIVLNPMTLVDLQRKRLVVHRVSFPTATLSRLIKYTKRGYYACPGMLQDLMSKMCDTYNDDDFAGREIVYID